MFAIKREWHQIPDAGNAVRSFFTVEQYAYGLALSVFHFEQCLAAHSARWDGRGSKSSSRLCCHGDGGYHRFGTICATPEECSALGAASHGIGCILLIVA